MLKKRVIFNKKHKRANRKNVGAFKKSPVTKYVLNRDFEFFQELQSLVLKASPAERDLLVQKLAKVGRVRLAVISGIFLDSARIADGYEAPADLFVVADDVDRRKLRDFLNSIEAETGCEIKFTLMEKEEFDYRFGMFDRFIRVLLEGPHEKIINKLEI